MTDTQTCQEVAVMLAAALAASIAAVLSSDQKTRIACEARDHARDLLTHHAPETPVSPSHREVSRLLNDFADKLSGAAPA